MPNLDLDCEIPGGFLGKWFANKIWHIFDIIRRISSLLSSFIVSYSIFSFLISLFKMSVDWERDAATRSRCSSVPAARGEWAAQCFPHPTVEMGTVLSRSPDQKHLVIITWVMFYPELSPAMRWHLDHNQKMYNMQMFSHQFSDKFSDQYGKINPLYLNTYI